MEQYFQQAWSFFNSFDWDLLRNNRFIVIGLISGVALFFSFLLYALCVRLYRKLFFLYNSKQRDTTFFSDDKFYDGLKLNVSVVVKKQLGDFFLRHVEKFMETNFQDFLKKRSPIFYQNEKSREIIFKCFPNDEEDKMIQELYIFWELGFHHPKLPLIFMIYFASIKKQGFLSILLSLLNYPNMDISQRKLIFLYFQDLLKKPIDIVDFPFDELDEIYQTNNLWLSQVISSYKYEWDISTFKEKISSFQIFKEIKYRPPMRDLLMFFMSKSTKLLRHYIVLNFTNFLGDVAGEVISQLVFKYGDYKKLLKITHPTKELRILTRSIFQNVEGQEDLRLLKRDRDLVITYLSKQRYAKLHIFYYLKAIDAPLGAAQHYGMNNDEVDKMMQGAMLLPIGVRWIFFQYLVYMQKWHKALVLFEMLGFYKNQTSAKILQFRCLFYSTNEVTKKEEYLNEIKKTSQENPENLSIMNEYAVHCIEMNKILDAQKTFKKMQKKDSNHLVALYNQALLFENLYSEAIKTKWGKLHQAKVS